MTNSDNPEELGKAYAAALLDARNAQTNGALHEHLHHRRRVLDIGSTIAELPATAVARALETTQHELRQADPEALLAININPHAQRGIEWFAQIGNAITATNDNRDHAAERHLDQADELRRYLEDVDDPNQLRDFITGVAEAADRYVTDK